jgi:hypothetical protein
MKELVLSLSLILLTSISFCQTGTKTAPPSSKDSLVVLPKRLVVYMIKDLVEGDGVKKQVVQQDSLIAEKNKELSLKDSTVSIYQERDRVYQATIEEFNNIETVNQKTIETLKLRVDKYKRQRNIFRAFCGALLIGIIIK